MKAVACVCDTTTAGLPPVNTTAIILQQNSCNTVFRYTKSIISSMEHFPQPIYRGRFSFRSILFVDPGDGALYPRASVSRLVFLIYGNNPEILTDEPWDFYAAQLVHYGLAFTKDKTDAKARLMEVLNTSTLVVPENILQMEEEMKAEWESDIGRELAYFERGAALSQSTKKVAHRNRAVGESSRAEASGMIQSYILEALTYTSRSQSIATPPLVRCFRNIHIQYFRAEHSTKT